MTQLAIGYFYTPFERIVNTGSSDESKRIEKMFTETLSKFRRSRVFDELFNALRECCVDDHDGHNAQAVTKQTYNLALRFLGALPVTLPSPEVGIDPDGEVSFEWIATRDKRLIVSLNPEGRLSYAGKFGHGVTTHGTEVFDDSIPEKIGQLVKGLGIRS